MTGFRIFLDIDNTLAVFSRGKDDDPRAVKESANPGFYRNLEPASQLWVYKILAKFLPVYIVSCYPETGYAKQEKLEWLNMHMPWIANENIILVPNGQSKVEFVESHIGDTISERDVLLDDYGKNLTDWAEAGGMPVKKSWNPLKKRNIPVVHNHVDMFKVLLKAAI